MNDPATATRAGRNVSRDGGGLRRSAALRVGASVLVAAGVSVAALALLWGPLDVSTDVVGYPTFKDFNGGNYFTAYYLAIGFFPLAALGLFLLLTRLAPRAGLATAPKRGPLRRAPASEPGSPLEGDPPAVEAVATRRRWVGEARVGFVGAVLGFEAGIALDSMWAGLAAGIATWTGVAWLLAGVAGPRLWPQWSKRQRLAAINALGTALTVLGLVAVSMSTQISLDVDGSVDEYPWFPLWLALPLAVAVAAAITLLLRRATGEGAQRIERGALLLVAAPVWMVMLLQALPGELGLVDYFHSGEQLSGAELVGEGLFPWRDVVLTQGILQNVIYTWGRWVFEDSIWGHGAGVLMIVRPLYLLSLYFLFVYLVGRNWLLLLFAVLIVVGTTLSPEQFRLILWPLILLLLASELDRPTALKAAGIGLLVVAQVALTPEAAPAIPAVAVVLLAYEWYRRTPGESLARSFRRTVAVGVAGVACAAAFFGFLAAAGALDDYVYLVREIVYGHWLSGAVPPSPGPGSISKAYFGFLALAPPAALLISIAYAIARLLLRRPFTTADWVMAAAAIFVVLYYPKFISRMDTGHVYQPFAAALPLLLYIVYRVVSAVEGAVRARWAGSRLLRVTAHPVSLAIVVLTAVLAWNTLETRVTKAADLYRPGASGPAKFERTGYTQVFDGPAFNDLKKIVDAYLDPDDRLFDFSNSPLLFYYLMDREPSTRYFHMSIARSTELQRDLIERLEREKPKLIVFDNDGDPFIALSNWDGMPSMVRHYDVAQWILDRYKPLLWSNGFTVYARRDQPPPSALDLDLSEEPVTRNVEFTVQPCTWGAIPNFLSGSGMPPPGAPAVGAQARTAPNQISVLGWAGDPKAELPAREVIATVDGRTAGTVQPSLRRADVVAFGLPEGFERSGFQMQVPDAPGGRTGRLRLFGVSRDGSYSEIVGAGEKPAKGTATIDGRTVDLEPNAVYGQINTTSRDQAMQFELPPGSEWTDYRWLEVDAGPGGFKEGAFTVYDRQDRPSTEREISFQTLDRSPRDYVIPVGSCAQWHGFRGDRLFLNFDRPQDVEAVRLIRDPARR